LAVAGFVASLGGLKVELEGVKGCLCTDKGDSGIDAGDVCDWLRVCPPPIEPRTNFCRGIFGAGVGFTFRVFKATLEIGVGFGGFRLVDIEIPI
jgi:hypothetical protein